MRATCSAAVQHPLGSNTASHFWTKLSPLAFQEARRRILKIEAESKKNREDLSMPAHRTNHEVREGQAPKQLTRRPEWAGSRSPPPALALFSLSPSPPLLAGKSSSQGMQPHLAGAPSKGTAMKAPASHTSADAKSASETEYWPRSSSCARGCAKAHVRAQRGNVKSSML